MVQGKLQLFGWFSVWGPPKCNKGWLTSGRDIPGEPGSQAPTKPSGSHAIVAAIHAVWCKFDFKVFLYFLSIEGILPITHKMQEIFSYHRRKFLVLQVINCHRKKFIFTEEEISCHR